MSACTCDQSVAMIEDNVDSAGDGATQPSSAASVSATLAPSSPAPPPSAATSPSSFSIPPGWQPKTRETNFYAVPVIVATSVILAAVVVSAIVGAVVWRTKARRRRGEGEHGEAEKGEMPPGEEDDEKNAHRTRLERAIRRMKRKAAAGRGSRKRPDDDPPGDGGTRASSISPASSGRVRRRRGAAGRRGTRSAAPSRASEADARDSDDEGTALTGGSVSGSNARGSTITSRIASRLRPSRSTVPPVVVLEDDTSLTPSQSRSSTLSRTSSNLTTVPSIPSVSNPEEAPTSHESSSSFIHDTPLPVPGPPAYRPSSSRHDPSTSSSHGPHTSPPLNEAEEEEAWHWPGEKVPRPAHGSTSSDVLPPSSPPPPPPPPAVEPEEDRVDRSMFVAHHATDDKAVLQRLRALADAGVRGSRDRERVEASAPAIEEEVDDDGFEWTPDDLATEDTGVEAGTSTRGSLPQPPRPVVTSFAYASSSTPSPSEASAAPARSRRSFEKSRAGPSASDVFPEAEGDEDHYLPVYVPRKEVVQDVLEMASAPPVAWEEEAGQGEGDDVGGEDPRVGQDREEHGEV